MGEHNTESEFVRHIPCTNPICMSSDANSLYSDGHTFVLAAILMLVVRVLLSPIIQQLNKVLIWFLVILFRYLNVISRWRVARNGTIKSVNLITK